MDIGIGSFSYHRYFGEHTAWETPLDIRWQTVDVLAQARAFGLGVVALQTVYLPPADAAAARELRAQLDDYGLRLVLDWGHRGGLEGGTNPAKVEDLRRWLAQASALGCTLMRITAGDQFSWHIPAAERIERLTPLLGALAQDAAREGVTLALENHADFRMADLTGMIRQVNADNLGICLDAANAVRVGDDPFDALALAAPYLRMLHLRDYVLVEASRGDPAAWWPAAPLGQGDLDAPGFLGRLAAMGYEGPVFIEMANMHPNWPDEAVAVSDSLAYLRRWKGALESA